MLKVISLVTCSEYRFKDFVCCELSKVKKRGREGKETMIKNCLFSEVFTYNRKQVWQHKSGNLVQNNHIFWYYIRLPQEQLLPGLMPLQHFSSGTSFK